MSYIKSIKEWKIRETITGFLEAKAMFEKTYKRKERDITYNNLKKICDLLFHAKEDNHLIFKKIINPRKRCFEEANKFTPNENELNFVNNTGLLFHKVMVSRELKYVLDFYNEDSLGYDETENSFQQNLIRIDLLFKQGIDIILKMLESHTNNIHLLIYIIENKEFCEKQFNKTLNDLIDLVINHKDLKYAYILSATYYFESGWNDKVKSMCKNILKIDPQNVEAKEMLSKIK